MIPKVAGILFDKDGTLFDFGATWEAWANAFLLKVSKGNHEQAERMAQALEFDLGTQSFAPSSVVIAGTLDEIEQVLRPYLPEADREQVLSSLANEAAQAPQVEAVPLHALLAELQQRGIILGVATNDGIDPAMAHLSAAGVTSYFDFIAGYDSGHGAKPGPGQLQAFCRELNLNSADVLMVGDSLHDLRAGQAAGMRTIGVLTGMAKAAELRPHADVVLHDIGEIPCWLDLAIEGAF